MKTVYFKKLDPRATLPQYMTPGSAGMDLSIILDRNISILPGEVEILNTGLAMEITSTMVEAQIRPRSGLSIKYPNYIANSPATVDSDYRGEIKIIFINNSKHLAVFGHGDRIAQIVFSRVYQVKIEETTILENTIRGAGGFGHTGIRR